MRPLLPPEVSLVLLEIERHRFQVAGLGCRCTMCTAGYEVLDSAVTEYEVRRGLATLLAEPEWVFGGVIRVPRPSGPSGDGALAATP